MIELVFILTTILSISVFYFGIGRNNLFLAIAIGWSIFIGSLAYIGFFKNVDSIPPRILLVLIPNIVFTIITFKKIDIRQVNLAVLTSVHIVRLPVEIVLYNLYLKGQIPVIMTFEGWNFDILMGITAICISMYHLILKKRISPTLLKTWNIGGLILLSIIVITAVLSVPLPIQTLAFDQPNVAVLAYPFTLLPAIVVPIVLVSHLLSIKVLFKK